MATHKDLERDFVTLCQDCYECWTKQDLQLAAELGKTLLERNKELETTLRQCQNVIDEQAQEIEYLTKQSTALRKTNDNRIRIYEQLEVSIHELERANQRLALDNSTNKKQINTLCAYRDSLEARCEDLEKALEDARFQQTVQKERLRRLSVSREDGKPGGEDGKKTVASDSQTSSEDKRDEDETAEDLVSELSVKNQELKSQMSKDQRKIADLEEEIGRMVQGIALLEQELFQRDEQVKFLREKMSSFEESRSENFCARCLKEVDLRIPQQLPTSFEPEEEEEVEVEEEEDGGGGGDESSSPLRDARKFKLEIKEDNPYRILADRYESLVKEQTENRKRSVEISKSSPLNLVSLQEELEPFDFNGLGKDQGGEEEENHGKEGRKAAGKSKSFSAAIADFSEAETSSSGFSDETSNKSTQTEKNVNPGYFLCSIADGDDCRFSIYDDACPIESRFRKTPEYRTLFREIFAVLKRAAEAKSNGEGLPLLDDEMPNVPPVTPAKEEPSVDFDDFRSISGSLNASEGTSEASSTPRSKSEDTLKDDSPEVDSSSAVSTPEASRHEKDVRSTNDIVQYLSVGLNPRRKTKRKGNSSPARRIRVTEMVEKIETMSPGSPRKSGGRKRREWRNYDSFQRSSRNQSPAVEPHVLVTLERRETPPNAKAKPSSSWSFQPFVSTAAQEVAKLKRLEKTYAEVLKQRPGPKSFERVKTVRLMP